MSTPDRSILDLMRRQGRKAPQVLLRSVEGDRASAPHAGKQRYELVEEIAQGGIGAVWRARDADLGRHAAIKVLREGYRGSPEAIERFVEEAQIGGQLQHPGIVPVYGLGLLEDGRPYFAMKLIKGRTLAEVLAERKQPARGRRQLLTYFEHVCQTVAYAHARGVIHRDLKPRNVMIGAFGEVQVVDWGFAKVLAHGGVADEKKNSGAPDVTIVETVRTESSDSDSACGSVMGTYAYMPPEQAMGLVEELDERADVFALGAILCEILTGRPPYRREDGNVVQQALTAELDDALTSLDRCGADAELVDLAKRCLRPRRAERPRTARELATAITGYLTSVEERAHRAELAEIEARKQEDATRADAEKARLAREQERRARRHAIALAAVLLLLVGGAAGTLLWMRQDRIARESRALAAIDVARREASFHEGRKEWVEAHAAAQRALDLAIAAEAGVDTVARVRSQVARYVEERRRAEEDRAMIARLEELRSRWANGDDHVRTDGDFAQAFRDYGFDIEHGDPAELGESLARRSIALQLAAALDEWALLRRSASKLQDRDVKPLLDVARHADPDPVRNEARDAIERKDVGRLRELSGRADLPAETMLLLGVGAAVARDDALAAQVLRRMLLRFPTNPWGHSRLAYVFGNMRDRSAAVRTYAAAVALHPESAQLNLQLGDSLIMDEQSARAVVFYRRAVALDPKVVRAHVGLGLALYDRKDYEGCVAACDEGIRQNPGKALPHYIRATALQELKRPEETEAAYLKAIELGPDLQMVHRELGTFYLSQGRHADAVKAYQGAIAAGDNDFGTWYRLGSAQLALRDLDGALESLQKAQRQRPDFATVNLWVARAYWLKRDWANALPWLERAHRLGTGAGNWPYPTAKFIQQAKAWQHIEPRLEKLLDGTEKPKDAVEYEQFAALCYEHELFAGATRAWIDLFAAHPALAHRENRYQAACSACRAASGRSKDKADDPAALRARALAWLRRSLDELRAGDAKLLQQRMRHWKQDRDLIEVRDAIDRLPAAEQEGWRRLWTDVAAAAAPPR